MCSQFRPGFRVHSKRNALVFSLPKFATSDRISALHTGLMVKSGLRKIGVRPISFVGPLGHISINVLKDEVKSFSNICNVVGLVSRGKPKRTFCPTGHKSSSGSRGEAKPTPWRQSSRTPFRLWTATMRVASIRRFSLLTWTGSS